MKRKSEHNYHANKTSTSRKLDLNILLKAWWIEKQDNNSKTKK